MTLTKFDGKKFTRIRKDVQVFGITEDRAGNIWFGTTDGAYCYDGKTFNNFSEGLKPKNSFDLDKKLFSLTGAKRILGEDAQLKDSSSVYKSAVSSYNCSYISLSKEIQPEKKGVIYFMLEKYTSADSAKQVYASIKKANENHGIKTLNDLGDEAYFHTDNQNFYFIMVRKGVKMFRVKVNKITSHTSLEEFNRFAREITEQL